MTESPADEPRLPSAAPRKERGRLDLPLREAANASTRSPAPADDSPFATLPPRRRRAAGEGRSQVARRAGRVRLAWVTAPLLAAAGLGYWFVGAPPRVELAPAALAFGDERVGRRGEPRELRLTNGGRRVLRLESVELVGPGAGDFAVVAESCGGRTLPGGAACTIAVAFAPQVGGERRAELTIVANAEAPRPSLSGTGTSPRLAVAPERVDFGRQPVGQTSAARTLALTNSGNAPLALTKVSLAGAGAALFQGVADGCSGRSLAPGQDCAASWTFRPARVGEALATVAIVSDAGASPPVVMAGIGVAPGLLLTPERLDFGGLRVGESSETRSVLLENTGNAPLVLTGLELAGDDREAFEIVRQGCASELAPGDNCDVEVRFRPTAEGGAAAGLRPRASGLAVRTEVALSGRGTVRRLALRPQRLEFGRVEEGSESRQSVVAQSVGGEEITLRRITVEGSAAGEFRLGGSCQVGSRLAGGRSCTIDVRFGPLGQGAREATLTVTHDGVGGALAVELAGGGFTPPVAGLEIEPAALDFGGHRLGERSGIESVRIASTGTARLELGDIRLTGEAAGDFQLVPASCSGIPFVAPGSDCVVGLRFLPRAAGPRRARLLVEHNASGGSAAVELVGEGFP